MATNKTCTQAPTPVGYRWLWLLLAAGIVGHATLVQAQEAPVSPWSAAHPPTPANLRPATLSVSDDLRRLPPVEPEASLPSGLAEPPAEPEAAADLPHTPQQPISAPPSPAVASVEAGTDKEVTPVAVDWSQPRVVIGPEGTTQFANARENVAMADPLPQTRDRPASAHAPDQPPARSRFSPLPPEGQPAAARTIERQTIVARVFDETAPPKVDDRMTAADPAETGPLAKAAQEESETTAAPLREPLSPIFACRLLGLPPAVTDARR